LRPQMFCFAKRWAAVVRTSLVPVLRSVRWGELVFLAGASGLGLIGRSSPEAGLGHLALRAGALALVALPVGAHVYLVNDICDRQRDRINPERRDSPLATGALATPAAWAWALLLGWAGLVAAGGLLGWMGLAVAAAILLNWDAYAWCGAVGCKGSEGRPGVKTCRWGKSHPIVAAGHNLVGGGLHFLLGVFAASGLVAWHSGLAVWTGYFGVLCLAGHFHHVARQEEADGAAGVTTAATLWGGRRALLASATAVVGSTVGLTAALVAQGQARGLALPLAWLWVGLPLYLLALRKVLVQDAGLVEQQRFQRRYRSLYVVFGLLLGPMFWGRLG